MAAVRRRPRVQPWGSGRHVSGTARGMRTSATPAIRPDDTGRQPGQWEAALLPSLHSHVKPHLPLHRPAGAKDPLPFPRSSEPLAGPGPAVDPALQQQTYSPQVQPRPSPALPEINLSP